MSEVKRWSAMYYPLGNLASPEAATMVFASDYDAKAAECERLREENERLAKDDDQWRAAWDEMRDAVLNGRGPLEAVLSSDQTNAVLSVIDEAHDSYIDAALSAVPSDSPADVKSDEDVGR